MRQTQLAAWRLIPMGVPDAGHPAYLTSLWPCQRLCLAGRGEACKTLWVRSGEKLRITLDRNPCITIVIHVEETLDWDLPIDDV
jgi:hypothetical protein